MRDLLARLAVSLIAVGVATAASYFLISALDPQAKERKLAAKLRGQLQSRLQKRDPKKQFETDEAEDLISGDVVDPESLDVRFADIGGMRKIKESLYEAVVLPFSRPDLFSRSSLLSTPRGVLLYGPPGTGKTMLAKAIAKEVNASFINVRLSTLQDKYFGETQKRIRALWTLAEKLAPTVIFIDEIDTFMRERQQTDDSHSASMKTEMMSWWDGLQSSSQNSIVVIAASNRPFDIDSAILRRLPRTFYVDLPDAEERLAILKVILRDNVTAALDLARIAADECTDGYSGSDLHELCKHAALGPLRHHLASEKDSAAAGAGVADSPPVLRPLTTADFLESLAHVRPTARVASDYYLRFTQQQRQLQTAGRKRQQAEEELD